MAYWLMKTEAETFSFADLERLGRDKWDGVRNNTAQIHLRQMAPGDLAFIYHSVKERAIVGVARIVSAPYPDPTAPDPKYVCVDVVPVQRLPRSVVLDEIKADPAFADWELVRISRLSVMPVSEERWQRVLAMAQG